MVQIGGEPVLDEKLDVYDILGILVPGVLIVCFIVAFVPAAARIVSIPAFPDAFRVVVLLSLALFAGQLVQTVASMIEPLLFLTWGGRPGDKALAAGLGDRYLPQETAKRIRSKLCSAIGGECTDRSLFLFAAQNTEGTGRVSKFNVLYAYHRALLTTVMLHFLVLLWVVLFGSGAGWAWQARLWPALGTLSVLVLVWYRTRQRALYYAREVLFTAERVLDGKTSPSTDLPKHGGQEEKK